jgi:hypothetical protein
MTAPNIIGLISEYLKPEGLGAMQGRWRVVEPIKVVAISMILPMAIETARRREVMT